jgi:hypothetical protein
VCNKVLRRIFVPKRDEVIGEWRQLHSESFIFCIRQIKSRQMRWDGHVARMREERKVYGVLVGKPEGKNHLEKQGVDGGMRSEWILGRLGCRVDPVGSG